MGIAADRARRDSQSTLRNRDGRRVVVVRAFLKKSRGTPRAEIELALRRAREVV